MRFIKADSKRLEKEILFETKKKSCHNFKLESPIKYYTPANNPKMSRIQAKSDILTGFGGVFRGKMREIRGA
jgi:hypothetical protein